MPRVIKKKVFVLEDVWEAVRTSRRVQIGTLVFVILAVAGGYSYSRYSERRDLIAQQEQTRRENDAVFVRRNFSFGSIQHPGKAVVLGVEVESGVGDPRADIIKTQLRERIPALFPKEEFGTDVLLPPFYDNRIFKETFQGYRIAFDQSRFFDHASCLLLVHASYVADYSAIGADMKTSNLTLVIRAYHSQNSPMKETIVRLTGLGSTYEKSLGQAFTGFDSHRKQLEPLLK